MSAPARMPLPKRDEASKARLRLWLRLLKTSRRVEGEVRRRLRDEHGATLPRFDVMAALYRDRAGLRMSALSEVLRVSNGNVTGIVDRLVSDGMVARTPVAGDRRATEVRLTEAGIAGFEVMAAAHEGWIDEMLGDITKDEAEALMQRLSRIAEGRE